MTQLTNKEIMCICMALSSSMEDLTLTLTDQRIPLTPKARKDAREILGNMTSAHEKLTSVIGQDIRLDPYNEGDAAQFLTKES